MNCAARAIDKLIANGLITNEMIAVLESSARTAGDKNIINRMKEGYPEWMLNFGSITELKKRGAKVINDWNKLAESLYPNGYANYNRVIGFNTPDLNGMHPFKVKLTVAALARWERYPRGRDLFIHGCGVFDINAALEMWAKEKRSYVQVPDPYELIQYGYIGGAGYYTSKAINDLIRRQDKVILPYIIANNDMAGRIDELKDYIRMGNRLTGNVRAALDDIVRRNLRPTTEDSEPFEYRFDYSKYLRAGFTVPNNGIDLKVAAKAFSNCSGGYVRKIANGESFIMWNDQYMVELDGMGRNIRQAFGRFNQRTDIDFDDYLLNVVASK